MRPRRQIAVVAALAFLAVIGFSCFNPNPYRAGEGNSSSIKAIPHDIDFGGAAHAEGMCDPANNCSACHGADLTGGSSGAPSCTECHGVVWATPDCGTNRHTVNLGGHMHGPNYCQPEAHCVVCHGSDLKGGPNGEPSCYSCHGAYWASSDCGQNSHTVNLGGVDHAPNYCRPYQNCTACHGSSLRGGSNGEPSCLQCHDQKNWMNCGGTQHNQSMDGIKHASGYCRPFDNCVFCHGDQLQGGPNHEPKCTNCHGQKWNESDCGDDLSRARR